MKKYKVIYTSKTDGDCCSVWTYATSKQDAINEVKHEYWDVSNIIDCYEI